jgi:hypothetical protein
MKKIKLLTLGFTLTSIISCTNYDFGDTNSNPNVPTADNPQALFTGAILASALTANTTQCLYSQFLSETQYTETSRQLQYPSSWRGYYTASLSDIEKAIELNTDSKTKDAVAAFGNNTNQIAVLNIYKSFIFAKVTDTWGDVPYSEALKSMKGLQPKYDSQESIYKGIIANLTEAEASFITTEPSMKDIIMNGNISKWKKFANSLRMIYSLRLSNRYPAASGYAAIEFNKAFNDSDGYIAVNADNPNVIPTTIYKNPWYLTFDGRNDYEPSQSFIDRLNTLNDKRIDFYALKGTGATHIGVPYGDTRENTLAFRSANSTSKFGTKLKEATKEVNLVTASHVNFSIAEAAKLGWITADATSFYNAGVKQSFLNSGLTIADYNSYILNTAVAYDDANALSLIATQRYIALFPNGFEAYNEYRRTGLPVLAPAIAPLNSNIGGIIPNRILYPADEPNLNSANYKAAVSALSDGDTGKSKVWWAK